MRAVRQAVFFRSPGRFDVLLKRIVCAIAAAALMLLANAAPAEAHWFEPQPHWWTSGRLCAASRNPPARRWQALPPRSCVSVATQGATLDAESATIVGNQEFDQPSERAESLSLSPVQKKSIFLGPIDAAAAHAPVPTRRPQSGPV